MFIPKTKEIMTIELAFYDVISGKTLYEAQKFFSSATLY